LGTQLSANPYQEHPAVRTRYRIIAEDGGYFITSTIVEWLPVFTSKPYFEILTDSLAFCRQTKALMLYAFVILDNHFHCILSGPHLQATVADLKRFTARRILEQLRADKKEWLLNQFAFHKKRHKTGSTHQVWQEGYHPQWITSEEMLIQKIEYIHHNPVKRGLVSLPEHWLYSSARGFISGESSMIAMDRLPR
jgi:putative transposase